MIDIYTVKKDDVVEYIQKLKNNPDTSRWYLTEDGKLVDENK